MFTCGSTNLFRSVIDALSCGRASARFVRKMFHDFDQLSRLSTQATLMEKGPLHSAILKHKQEVMAARQLYHFRRARAKGNPHAYCSIIIDAMDQACLRLSGRLLLAELTKPLLQAKTHVPYSTRERISQKDVDTERLTQRIHGVIVHGLGTYLYILEPDIVSKGANQGN